MRIHRAPGVSALAILAAVALTPLPGRADDLDDAFKAPPASARPWARWWWPGGAVTPDGLEESVGDLKAGGFGGGEIQPFVFGFKPGTSRRAVDDYATPGFAAKVREAARQAQTQGLGIDYTFGSAWPSGGGAAITPELALVELTMAATSVEGGTPGPIKVALPKRTGKLGGFSAADPLAKDPRFSDWPARINAQQKVVAVVAVRGDGPQLIKRKSGFKLYPWSDVVASGALEPGSSLVLTDKLGADGTLDWSPPPGRWQILVFKQYVVDNGITGGAGAEPQLVLDHFRRAAFDAHARRVGDPIAAGLGARKPVLGSVFIDSLELMQDLPWSRDFLEAFKKRRGYDLTPYLPLVLQPGWMQSWDQHYSPPYYQMGDLGDRVREDYRQTISDLEVENFFAPFAQWAKAHGVKSRLQAHGATSDILRSYGVADIPETEDLEYHADPHFMRIARAAADHGGKPLVSAESFAIKDEPYDVAPARLRARADLLFAGGVNHIVEHGVSYPFASEVWPGWFPFAPLGHGGFSTMIGPANPTFPGIARLNAYITRMQSVLRQGRNIVPVALYYGQIGYYSGIEAKGGQGLAPNQSLLAGGYDYDRINDDLLARARVVDGALVTGKGTAFHALVFPAGVALRPATAERVARFARQGLKVVFVEAPPARAWGLADHERGDRRVRAAISQAQSAGATTGAAADLPGLLRAQGVNPNLTFESGSALFVQRRAKARSVYFLHNPAGEATSLALALPDKGRVEQWDAWSGERRVLASRTGADGQTRLALRLEPGASALLAVGGPEATPTPSASAPTPLLTLDGPWSLSARGHGAGGRTIGLQIQLETLVDWRQIDGLADLAGAGTYARSLTLSASDLSAGKILLDLGEVSDIASVSVNGKTFGPEIGPFVFDVTEAVVAGENRLQITVANTPNNAFVGKTARLLTAKPAGLRGPVRVLIAPRAKDGPRAR